VRYDKRGNQVYWLAVGMQVDVERKRRAMSAWR
jgi:hypothetical protein